MKKSKSLKTNLIISMTTAFFIFAVAIGSTSYGLLYNKVYSISEEQILSSNQQSLANYDTYFDSVISVSTSVQTKSENIDVEHNSDMMGRYFDDILTLKSDINSMAIYGIDGELLAHSTKYTPTEDPFSQSRFLKSIENPLVNVFSRIQKLESNSYAFTVSKLINYGKASKNAVLKVDYDFSEMANLINKTNLGYKGHVTIYDEQYNVVYCSTDYELEEKNIIENLVLGTEKIKKGNDTFNLFASTISKTRWKVAIFTNINNVVHILNTFLITVIVSIVAIMIIFTFFILILSSQVTSPIKLLQLEMAKVASLNYKVEDLTEIKGSKEVEDLNKSFNKMMLRIRELASQLVEEENNKRISELKALQNQINPHFLYNTLDSIVYLIDSDEKEKATAMIIALSKFFRISISKGKNIIPLSKEVEHVTNYLLIQKIRFGKQFEYTIDVDPILNDVPVIKLILQPIVENSIVHGFNELEYVGRIDITGKIENDFIRFDIKDNGYGILPEKVEEIYASFKDDSIQEGVGFKNVYQRLRLYYGPKADIKIISDLDVGTDVVIFIPYDGGNKNEKK